MKRWASKQQKDARLSQETGFKGWLAYGCLVQTYLCRLLGLEFFLLGICLPFPSAPGL